jgi:hypothetical protein
MNALVPMVLLQQDATQVTDGEQPRLQGGTVCGPSAWRDLWHSRHGVIRIEVIDGVCYVNGDRVEPLPSAGYDANARHRRRGLHLGAGG